MQTNGTPLHRVGAALTRAWNAVVRDTGPWFFFFVVVYIIVTLKAVTVNAVYDHIFFGTYSVLITTYILSRFLLSYMHKPIRYDPRYEPSVAFVVPAKNEEGNIRETLRRFAEVEYPREKIEVIAINDGSTDGTLKEMQRAHGEVAPHVRRFEIINWTENRGKRAGMATGAFRATHDIVIFIDSDSFIEKDAVRHLVKYFADTAVGAVSGHTDVWNRDTNLLTQMQAIRYYIAFKVYKAAESVFGSVTCCPGCCSAYRRAYIIPLLSSWLHQKFLGTERPFGDDRSLTNFVIRKYRAVYSAEARAHTVVPDSFGVYVRQQQRWKKSWVRETFIASTFMWRKHWVAALSFYSYVFLAFASPIVFFRALVWHPLVLGVLPIVYLLGLLLMLLMHGLYYRARVGPRAWFLAIVNFWFNTVLLMWQLPWAIVTIRDSRWGTR